MMHLLSSGPSSHLYASPAAQIRAELRTSIQETRRDLGWNSIDSQLNEWLNDLDSLVDCDAQPPSRAIIRAARNLIIELRAQGWVPPVMVVPNMEGGISFEFHSGSLYRDLEVLKTGEVWLTDLRDNVFQKRSRII